MLRAPSERMFGTEIVGRHHDPYTMARRFEQPFAASPYQQPVTDGAGRVLARMLGSGVAAYNVVVLASFPLAALFAYLLVRRLGGSTVSSVAAGLLYAFSPFHLAHAAYHPHVAQVQWLPLYLLALWLALERASAGRLAFLASSAALAALADSYTALIAAVLTPVAVLGFWWARPRTSARPLVRTALALLLVAAAGVLYAAVVAGDVVRNLPIYEFDRSQPLRYGAMASSYVTPAVEHPALGSRSRELWASRAAGDAVLEQQVTIGFGLLGLAVSSLVFAGRTRPKEAALALIALAAFLFSLRPELELAGIGIPMPSALIHAVLPVFRAYARFGIALFLAIAALAALGFDRLHRRSSRPALAAAVALLALTLFELAPWPPWRWRDVLPTPAHRWLAQQPEGVQVLDCVPAVLPAETVTLHFFPQVMGVRPEEDCWPTDVAGWLAARDYTHLLVRDNTRVLERWNGTPRGLEVIEGFGGTRLFEVAAPPAELSAEFVSGFHRAEIKGADSYRWMGGSDRAILLLLNRANTPIEATIALELHAFPTPRRVQPRLQGHELESFEVGTEPRSYPVGPLALNPGFNALALATVEPGVVADEILGNGDLRRLSVALWGWTWQAPDQRGQKR